MATSTSTMGIGNDSELPANKSEQKDFLKWLMQRKSLNVLLTGKTGAGKSTLVNSLVGEIVAKEGDTHEPETKEVTEHKMLQNGQEITVWDSPGFQDGTNKEEEYLAAMKAKCKDIDLLLYCISLKTERSDLESTIVKLTEAFGPKIWKNSVFVLTHANSLRKRLIPKCKEVQIDLDHEKSFEEPQVDLERTLEKLFEERISQWKVKIQSALRKVQVAEDIISNISVEAAGHYRKPSLPGRPFWLSRLWGTCFHVMKEQAKPVMIKASAHRMRKEKDVKDEDFESAPTEAHVPIVIDHCVVAAGVGSGLLTGGGIGAVVGGLIGGVLVGVGTLGLGVGIGAGIGAAVGGGIGLGLGAGATIAYAFAVSVWRKSKMKKTGQVDFAETTETENGNGNTETRKEKKSH